MSAELNRPNRMDGMVMMSGIGDGQAAAVFFDPQYTGALCGRDDDRQQPNRMRLPQMPDPMIRRFMREISRILAPGGHLFLWCDTFQVTRGFGDWMGVEEPKPVDMICWDKRRFGLGYRSRHVCEYCVIWQKAPRNASRDWRDRNIPSIWREKIVRREHVHAKPVGLQERLVRCVTEEGDLVVDPCAGSYSVLRACVNSRRRFLGADLRDAADYGKGMNR